MTMFDEYQGSILSQNKQREILHEAELARLRGLTNSKPFYMPFLSTVGQMFNRLVNVLRRRSRERVEGTSIPNFASTEAPK
jgi:hypothetical protein